MSIRFILTKNTENTHELIIWNNEIPVTHKMMYVNNSDSLGKLVNAGFIGQDEKNPFIPYGESLSLDTTVDDLAYGLVVELFGKGNVSSCMVPVGNRNVPALYVAMDGECPFIERSKIVGDDNVESAFSHLFFREMTFSERW